MCMDCCVEYGTEEDLVYEAGSFDGEETIEEEDGFSNELSDVYEAGSPQTAGGAAASAGGAAASAGDASMTRTANRSDGPPSDAGSVDSADIDIYDELFNTEQALHELWESVDNSHLAHAQAASFALEMQ